MINTRDFREKTDIRAGIIRVRSEDVSQDVAPSFVALLLLFELVREGVVVQGQDLGLGFRGEVGEFGAHGLRDGGHWVAGAFCELWGLDCEDRGFA